MTIQLIQSYAHTWAGAADYLIGQIAAKGVKKGQILWIDAQCGGGTISYCYLVAYWDDGFKTSEGVGTIKYNLQNTVSSWESFYKNAADLVKFLQPKNVISITGSVSVFPITALFVFYYEDSPAEQMQDIRYCSVRGSTWEGAATNIIDELESNGAKAGQLIAIDGHNNSKEDQAIYAAFWNNSLPALGDLTRDNYLKRVTKNDMDSWSDHYQFARHHIQTENYKNPLVVFGATSSVNSGFITWLPNGVTTVFYATDVVHEVKVDEEKLEKTNSKVNIREQRFPNQFSEPARKTWMSAEEKTTTTSSVFNFKHTEGVTLTPSTTFTFGVPEGVQAAFGLSIAYTNQYEWQQTDSITKSVTTKNEYTDTFEVPPKHLAVCQVYADRTTFTAPYTMTFKSGRTSHGIWTATKEVVNMDHIFVPLGTPEADIVEKLKTLSLS